MQNDIITIKQQHIQAAEFAFERMNEKREAGSKFVIAIAGEVSSGKSTLAYLLGRMYKMNAINAKIIDLDDFYKIPPLERKKWRKDKGLHAIGADEYDWKKVENCIYAFSQSEKAELPSVDLLTDHVDLLHTDFGKVEVLIVNGLYAFNCPRLDFKVFIELTYRETHEAQKFTGKEQLDDFRMKILEKEHVAVKKQKNEADIFIDFNTFLDTYHL